MSLVRKVVRGAALGIITSTGSRVLGLVGTLLLVRYVAPAPYGEVSAASVLVLSANHFSTLGLGMFIVANPNAGRPAVFHATFFHLLLGIMAIGGVVLWRGPLGPVFDAPGLSRYVPGLALSVLIDRLAYMPERILVRDLRFGSVSLSRTLGELVYSGISVLLAMRGWGAMSVVWGNIARSAVRAVVVLTAVHWREWIEPHPIRTATLGKMSSYSVAVAVANLAGFAARRWDNLVISRLFGPAVLGQYNLAYNLADIPATQIGEQITDVLLASFPHVKPEERHSVLLRATRILALIMFPMAVGLGMIAHPLAAVFFDQRWSGVGDFLMYLSALSIPRPIGGAIGAYLHACNRPWVDAAIEWTTLAVMMGLMLTMGRLGPLWAASAVGVAFALRYVFCLYALKKLEGISMLSFGGALLPPFFACLVMVAGIAGTRWTMGILGWRSPSARLGIEIVAGALIYVAAALLIARTGTRELRGLAQHFIKRRRPETAS